MGIENGGFDDVPLITHNEINVDGNPRYEPESVAEKIKSTEEVIKHREESIAALEEHPEALSSLAAAIGHGVTGEQILKQDREQVESYKAHLEELRRGGSLKDNIVINKAASRIFAGTNEGAYLGTPEPEAFEPVSNDMEPKNPYDTSEISKHIEGLSNLIRITEKGANPGSEQLLEKEKDELERDRQIKIARDALRDMEASEIFKGRGNNPEMTS